MILPLDLVNQKSFQMSSSLLNRFIRFRDIWYFCSKIHLLKKWTSRAQDTCSRVSSSLEKYLKICSLQISTVLPFYTKLHNFGMYIFRNCNFHQFLYFYLFYMGARAHCLLKIIILGKPNNRFL